MAGCFRAHASMVGFARALDSLAMCSWAALPRVSALRALFMAANPSVNVIRDWKRDEGLSNCYGCHVPVKQTDWACIDGYPTLKSENNGSVFRPIDVADQRLPLPKLAVLADAGPLASGDNSSRGNRVSGLELVPKPGTAVFRRAISSASGRELMNYSPALLTTRVPAAQELYLRAQNFRVYPRMNPSLPKSSWRDTHSAILR